jgi:hypothetical protein
VQRTARLVLRSGCKAGGQAGRRHVWVRLWWQQLQADKYCIFMINLHVPQLNHTKYNHKVVGQLHVEEESCTSGTAFPESGGCAQLHTQILLENSHQETSMLMTCAHRWCAYTRPQYFSCTRGPSVHKLVLGTISDMLDTRAAHASSCCWSQVRFDARPAAACSQECRPNRLQA